MNPTRVIVDYDAFGVTPERAERDYGFVSDIVFRRSDGWTLGAPSRFENTAYELWRNEWTHFMRSDDTDWVSINEYR